jgi:mRNA interferase MazF
MIPTKGDIIIVNFDPTKGHEQKGLRPAIVISNSLFNSKTKFLLVAPITSKTRKDPFEVVVDTKKTKGVILSNQIRIIDALARKIKIVDNAPSAVLNEVIKKVDLIYK